MLALGLIAALAAILWMVSEIYAHSRRRSAALALARLECNAVSARLRTLEDHFPQALIAMDARGLIRRANPAAEQLFGYQESEIVGHSILRLLPYVPSARPHAQSPTLRLNADGSDGREGSEAEIDVRLKDGSTLRVRMRGARAAVEDSTDVYMYFEAADAATATGAATAVGGLPAVERVVGRIVLQFEELLTTINGYAELALHAETPARRELEEIADASDRASHLLRNLLAFSGNQLIPLEAVDLNAAVRAAVSPLVPLDLDPAHPLAHVNAECLSHLLTAFWERAIARGGPVSVVTRQVAWSSPRRCYSRELGAGSYAALRISDAGARLTPEELERMFEPLRSTHHALDLAPLYGIVHSMGGAIDVVSQAVGTTFELLFPLPPRPRDAVDR